MDLLAGSERGQVGEDLVGVGRDVPDPVGLADDSFGIDHVGPTLRPGGIGLLRGPLRLVSLSDGAVDVRQQPKGEPELLGEGPILLGRVEGRPQDDGVGLLEVGGSITEPLPFGRSPGGVGLHVPPQHHPPSPEIRQGDRLTVLVREGEVGRRGALPKHLRSLR
jgi:hypothetical protein